MKYYLDCEFDGHEGQLLSMALVSYTGRSMYVVMNRKANDPWVQIHVEPLLFTLPLSEPHPCVLGADAAQLSEALEVFFKADMDPHVIADWPDDLKYLSAALITGPGTMIDVPNMKMSVRRVNAYPTTLEGALQHNAWWDAMALRHLLMGDA